MQRHGLDVDAREGNVNSPRAIGAISFAVAKGVVVIHFVECTVEFVVYVDVGGRNTIVFREDKSDREGQNSPAA
jgi:hypothetical protein